MIELIEDSFGWSYCGDDKHIIIDIAKHPRYKDPYTVEEGKQIKREILQNQKLRELVKNLPFGKLIELCKKQPEEHTLYTLQIPTQFQELQVLLEGKK